MSNKLNITTTTQTDRKLGEGTYGIIIGYPRLPSVTETYKILAESSNAPNQVSKVIKDKDDIEKLNKIIDLLFDRFTPSKLAALQTQIVIPSRPEIINWPEIKANPTEDKYLQSLNITKRRTKWQYIMERGTKDLDKELKCVKSLNQLKHFLKGFANIITGIAALHTGGLVHTDIKLTNMIKSWDGCYKLIDLDELGDANKLPTSILCHEKIYNNTYYPFYPPVSVFLKVLPAAPVSECGKNSTKVLFDTLIKKKYNKDYHKYFNDISQDALKLANDPELTNIIQGPYENDESMLAHITNFKELLSTQPNSYTAHNELLLFIDRYSLGINLLILLTKYYRITRQIPSSNAKDINTCDFIPQTLVSLIKLCCDTANYARITTKQIADEYNKFIVQLFKAYPFKFIINLLSGIGIRHKKSEV
jgi:serine/threonine protein kinase